MQTRREFLRHAALLTGTAAVWGVLPESIQKALAIDPAEGTTFLDAEHIVILMQENRSFDHCFGALQGVRGFNDPRAHILPNGNPVWLQTNPAGETYAPFRLNIKETSSTWMGSLPHSWTNQVDARNEGRYDRWLQAKPSGHKDYAKMPLTLGHYTREDIPFYYAFADAFTVCDQHFSSSLTGTTPNRSYLWTGSVRDPKDPESIAAVRNEEIDYGREAKWKTFPERMEQHGVSWRIYQNEISLDSGFQGEEDAWLANFTDNPIEWFTQYNVRFAKSHRAHVARQIETLKREVEAGGADAEAKRKRLGDLEKYADQWSDANWQKLSPEARSIHEKAFTTNEGDPHYRELTTIKYDDGGQERTVQVPKGDTLFRFRQDVETGKLPTVSYLVAPENFSDHPGAAWYGAWYVSEVLDILTKNPEVWKKTIFILTYDENDGYFDHVPPFVAPHPDRADTGRVSAGIDPRAEYVTLAQDRKRKSERESRDSAVGLGFRVPLVVASPWSRGGCVNSEVFDHTSVLQFLEVFLTHKTGKKVEESNISAYRRAICGDLTSIFVPFNGEKTVVPPFPDRDVFIESIHRARFKKLPDGFKGLSADEVAAIRRDPTASPYMVRQEPGTRKSCPLPYELAADAVVNGAGTEVHVKFQAKDGRFGKKAVGSPFNAYAYQGANQMTARSYAVKAGDALSDAWPLAAFDGGRYHLRVDGPNGFTREFKGDRNDPVSVEFGYGTGRKVEIRIRNRGGEPVTVEVRDRSYGGRLIAKLVRVNETITVDAASAQGWYDLAVTVRGMSGFERVAAGRVETGQWSITDPAMAGDKK